MSVFSPSLPTRLHYLSPSTSSPAAPRNVASATPIVSCRDTCFVARKAVCPLCFSLRKYLFLFFCPCGVGWEKRAVNCSESAEPLAAGRCPLTSMATFGSGEGEGGYPVSGWRQARFSSMLSLEENREKALPA